MKLERDETENSSTRQLRCPHELECSIFIGKIHMLGNSLWKDLQIQRHGAADD